MMSQKIDRKQDVRLFCSYYYHFTENTECPQDTRIGLTATVVFLSYLNHLNYVSAQCCDPFHT